MSVTEKAHRARTDSGFRAWLASGPLEVLALRRLQRAGAGGRPDSPVDKDKVMIEWLVNSAAADRPRAARPRAEETKGGQLAHHRRARAQQASLVHHRLWLALAIKYTSDVHASLAMAILLATRGVQRPLWAERTLRLAARAGNAADDDEDEDDGNDRNLLAASAGQDTNPNPTSVRASPFSLQSLWEAFRGSPDLEALWAQGIAQAGSQVQIVRALLAAVLYRHATEQPRVREGRRLLRLWARRLCDTPGGAVDLTWKGDREGDQWEEFASKRSDPSSAGAATLKARAMTGALPRVHAPPPVRLMVPRSPNEGLLPAIVQPIDRNVALVVKSHLVLLRAQIDELRVAIGSFQDEGERKSREVQKLDRRVTAARDRQQKDEAAAEAGQKAARDADQGHGPRESKAARAGAGAPPDGDAEDGTPPPATRKRKDKKRRGNRQGPQRSPVDVERLEGKAQTAREGLQKALLGGRVELSRLRRELDGKLALERALVEYWSAAGDKVRRRWRAATEEAASKVVGAVVRAARCRPDAWRVPPPVWEPYLGQSAWGLDLGADLDGGGTDDDDRRVPIFFLWHRRDIEASALLWTALAREAHTSVALAEDAEGFARALTKGAADDEEEEGDGREGRFRSWVSFATEDARASFRERIATLSRLWTSRVSEVVPGPAHPLGFPERGFSTDLVEETLRWAQQRTG